MEVVRAFQKERLPAARDIAAIRMDVDEFRRAHAEERALRIAAENSYVPLRAHQIRRGALLWFAAAASLHLLAVAAVAVIGFVLTEQYLKLSSMAELTLRGLILLLPGGGAFYRIKDVHWSSYRRRVKESDRIALDELRSKQQATR